MATAILQSYNQTPRKVRLVTDLVKGKKVSDALAALEFLQVRSPTYFTLKKKENPNA